MSVVLFCLFEWMLCCDVVCKKIKIKNMLITKKIKVGKHRGQMNGQTIVGLTYSY